MKTYLTILSYSEKLILICSKDNIDDPDLRGGDLYIGEIGEIIFLPKVNTIKKSAQV